MDLETADQLQRNLADMIAKKRKDPGYQHRPQLYDSGLIQNGRLNGVNKNGEANIELVPSQAKPLDNLVVSIRVTDKKGEKEKMHVDQTVKVSKDGQLNHFLGGEFAETDDAPVLEFGTRITGKLGDLKDETRSLTLKVEFSSRFDSRKSKTPVVRGEVVAVRVDVKLGETTRVSLGKNRWCELRLVQQ